MADTPEYLYKVISKEAWEESLQSYFVFLSEMDSEFIHFALESQLQKVIDKFLSGAGEFFVLKVETKNLPGKMVYETNPGGVVKYYHLYNGWIPLEAIVQAVRSEELACN